MKRLDQKTLKKIYAGTPATLAQLTNYNISNKRERKKEDRFFYGP